MKCFETTIHAGKYLMTTDGWLGVVVAGLVVVERWW